jgi:hypothetical protein
VKKECNFSINDATLISLKQIIGKSLYAIKAMSAHSDIKDTNVLSLIDSTLYFTSDKKWDDDKCYLKPLPTATSEELENGASIKHIDFKIGAFDAKEYQNDSYGLTLIVNRKVLKIEIFELVVEYEETDGFDFHGRYFPPNPSLVVVTNPVFKIQLEGLNITTVTQSGDCLFYINKDLESILKENNLFEERITLKHGIR